ncbi:MAG: transposase [Deltaproteobacteria bacterium]|nr:transposase [Deltaproteobacteria bacterium]
MNRGRRREEICLENNDYLAFIDLLQESAQMFNVGIAAYCLMPNHYHLFILTPDQSVTVYETLRRCLYPTIQQKPQTRRSIVSWTIQINFD